MPVRQCRLVLEGELSAPAGRAFDGMTLTCGSGTTHLVGPVRDQAELHHLLQRVSDLGLTLVMARVTDDDAALAEWA